MNAQYRHNQPGYLMIVVGLILITIGAILFAYGLWPLWVPIGAIGIFLFVFGYKLTVEIKDGFLRFWFGVGIFWKKVAIEQIAYCEPYRGVIFGWGIHWGPGGWLYNVSGMKAVTVVLKTGKRMHIGTDEPVVLIEAINSAIGVKGSGKTSGLWTEVKADYLKRVEQALSAARHPKSFEILAEVGNHLDRRFAELAPQQRTWENFQRIITEMGPPSEYAELVGSAEKNIKTGLSIEYRTIFVLVLAVVAAGMIILPKVLNQQKISEIQWTIENDPELVGKWVSVDFVKEPNDFSLIEKRWPGDLYVKDIAFNSDRTTTIGWSWTKGWIIDWSWTKGWIIDNGSGIKAEYEIRNIGGVKYLFLPWLNGDVIIRHQKPQYYVLKKVTETAQKAQNENNQATESAVEAAKAWLQLVDDGQYGQSWSQAAEYFKKFINEEQWKTSVEPVRRPLGRVLSRKVLSSTYTTTVPGAPDGQYVVIQFETSFENKQNAVETVTPMMEPNAQWRVSGYYIK